MRKRTLVVEWRYPRTKEERGVFGQCVSKDDTIKIFINTRKNRDEEYIKTFWHEICHAFYYIHCRAIKRISKSAEEKICRKVEDILWALVR